MTGLTLYLALVGFGVVGMKTLSMGEPIVVSESTTVPVTKATAHRPRRGYSTKMTRRKRVLES